MRAYRVVVIAPLLDDDLCFLEAVEDFLVEALIAQLAVEGLAIAVLPWTARLDVEGLGPEPGEPSANDLGCHLGAVVGSDVFRDATVEHHVRQRLDDDQAVDAASNPDSQALATMFVDQCHETDATAVMGLSLDEVIAPHMIAMHRPQPDA